MRYLDPKADLTFKRVFGEHPNLVRSFLNALLPLSDNQMIESIEYLPTELIPESPWRKFSIVDVRCKDSLGRQFIVEMQMLWSPEFKTRVLFNASKAYVRQAPKGIEYGQLQPVYSLNLVNEIFEPDLKDYYHHYRMVHEKDSNRVIEGLQLVFIELPKFKPSSQAHKKMHELWLRFLTEISSGTESIDPELTANSEVAQAIEELRESAFDDKEIEAYDKFWDGISLEKSLIGSAEKKGREEGRMEGREEGRMEGREEGRMEGRMEGREEGRMEEKADIARKLKSLGLPSEQIAAATGLDKEHINSF